MSSPLVGADFIGFLRDESDRADDVGRILTRDRLARLADHLVEVRAAALSEDWDRLARILASIGQGTRA